MAESVEIAGVSDRPRNIDFDVLADRIYDPESPAACEAASVIRYAGKLEQLYAGTLCVRTRRWLARRLNSLVLPRSNGELPVSPEHRPARDAGMLTRDPNNLGAHICPRYYERMLERTRYASDHWLQLNTQEFAAAYNRRPFLVSHRLQDHPLFTLPSLMALCRRLNVAKKVLLRRGAVPMDADFDTAAVKFRGELTLDDAIEHLEEKRAYIIVNNPEIDPEYAATIEGLIGEIALQTHRVDPVINWYSSYLFISARDSLTPYHMDREMNFLLQIRGTKTAQLWDPNDDMVMTGAEKDELLSYKGQTRPKYRPALESTGETFDLKPGLGVHHPFIAPHLVRTGPELSISLALTFRTRQSDIWTDAHRINYGLRRLGLNPKPVGRSRAMDRSKASMLRAVRRTRSLVRRA